MVQSVRPWSYRFLRKKNGVTWILTYVCVIEWPLRVVRRSLGRLRGDLLRMFSSLHGPEPPILDWYGHRVRLSMNKLGMEYALSLIVMRSVSETLAAIC